jgi:hypothetical protein
MATVSPGLLQVSQLKKYRLLPLCLLMAWCWMSHHDYRFCRTRHL